MSNLNGVNNHNVRPFPGTPPTTIIRPTTQPPPAAGMPAAPPHPLAFNQANAITNENNLFDVFTIPQGGHPTIRPQAAEGQPTTPVPPMPHEVRWLDFQVPPNLLRQAVTITPLEIARQILGTLAVTAANAVLENNYPNSHAQVLPILIPITKEILRQIPPEMARQILGTLAVTAADVVLANNHLNNHAPTLPIHEQTDTLAHIPNPETNPRAPTPPTNPETPPRTPDRRPIPDPTNPSPLQLGGRETNPNTPERTPERPETTERQTPATVNPPQTVLGLANVARTLFPYNPTPPTNPPRGGCD